MSFEYDIQGIGGKSADLSIFGDITFEDLTTKMLEAVTDKAVTTVKDCLKSSIKHSGSSELVESVSASKTYKLMDGSGAGVTISPKGKRSKASTYKTSRKDSSHKNGGTRDRAVSNHDVAFWLEYGVAGRQPAHPWQDRAYRRVEDVVTPLLESEMSKVLGAE